MLLLRREEHERTARKFDDSYFNLGMRPAVFPRWETLPEFERISWRIFREDEFATHLRLEKFAVLRWREKFQKASKWSTILKVFRRAVFCSGVFILLDCHELYLTYFTDAPWRNGSGDTSRIKRLFLHRVVSGTVYDSGSMEHTGSGICFHGGGDTARRRVPYRRFYLLWGFSGIWPGTESSSRWAVSASPSGMLQKVAGENPASLPEWFRVEDCFYPWAQERRIYRKNQ